MCVCTGLVLCRSHAKKVCIQKHDIEIKLTIISTSAAASCLLLFLIIERAGSSIGSKGRYEQVQVTKASAWKAKTHA